MGEYFANVGGCGESVGYIGAKCQSANLRRTTSTEMKKHTRLKEAIKDRIRAVNDNLSQEKPRVTY
jgi:hypothetical protein